MSLRTRPFTVDEAIPTHKKELQSYLAGLSEAPGTVVTLRAQFGSKVSVSVTSDSESVHASALQLSAAISLRTLEWTISTEAPYLVRELIRAHVLATMGRPAVVFEMHQEAGVWTFIPLDSRSRVFSVPFVLFRIVTDSLDIASLASRSVFGSDLATLALARIRPGLFPDVTYLPGEALLLPPVSDFTSSEALDSLIQAITSEVASLDKNGWVLDHRHPRTKFTSSFATCRHCKLLRDLSRLWAVQSEVAGHLVYRRLVSCGDSRWKISGSIRECILTGSPADIRLPTPSLASVPNIRAGLEALMKTIEEHPTLSFYFDDSGRFRSLRLLQAGVFGVRVFTQSQLTTFISKLYESELFDTEQSFLDFDTFEDAVLARFELLRLNSADTGTIVSALDFPEAQLPREYRLLLRTPTSVKLSSTTREFAITNSLDSLGFCDKESLETVRTLYNAQGPTYEVFREVLALKPLIRSGVTVCMAEAPLPLDRRPELHRLGWSGLFTYGGLPGFVAWGEHVLSSPPTGSTRHLDIDDLDSPEGRRVIFRLGADVQLDLAVSPDLSNAAVGELTSQIVQIWELGLWLDPWSSAYYDEVGTLPSFVTFRNTVSKLGFSSHRFSEEETGRFSEILSTYTGPRE